MKIALLNLPLDNNYGGNLQRYALVKVLQNLGHDVEHINMQLSFSEPIIKLPYLYLKRIIRYLFVDHHQVINKVKYDRKRYADSLAQILPFYDRYIPHTSVITSIQQLKKLEDFDAFIVGSDQVWRKKMTRKFGLPTYFLDFVPNNIRKIAFSVSFGVSENELSISDIQILGALYKRFTSVSVREISGIDLIKQYGWEQPHPELLLDPTFLLKKEDYIKLITEGKTYKPTGTLFCYILDKDIAKMEIVKQVSIKKSITPCFAQLGYRKDLMSIEQWLRSIAEADYVITDSYHGLVFSIIFNKPFKLLYNKNRGNTRFESLLQTLEINKNPEQINWNEINKKIEYKKEQSFIFLEKSLK